MRVLHYATVFLFSSLIFNSANAQTPNFPGAFEPAGWSFSVGAGGLVTPSYEGSDEYSVKALPNFSAKYGDRFSFAPRNGLRYNVLVLPNPTGVLKVGAGVGVNFGRDEGASNHLNGMGDIDATAEGKVFVDYRFKYASLGMVVTQDLAGKHEGLTVKTKLATGFPIPSQDIFISPSVNLTYANQKYNQSFFGVTNAQSVASGLAVYTPNSGFKDVSLNLLGAKKFGQNWSVASTLGYKYLLGDAGNSPVVKKRNQFTGGLFLSYDF